ncbi:hypothetical protein OEA41_004823 [Lepraria neglecta]|uniref:Major facilitator superfamily (MFS) profile domain-containing protein n=1 Tax=Lepraria neglecta TaxID=209136 RepID=A0AAD9YYN6_9LECA|nr:hypothetical protein OEA41_004823 [Lepraria neglecta]
MTNSSNSGDATKETAGSTPAAGGHMMSATDPDNPQNWPVYKKVYVSVVAFAFSWVVAFGATAYTPGITGVVQHLDVTMQVAILGLSLYLLGIAFAPITTPHLSERYGRQAVYLVTLPIFALFILGASFSHSFAALAVCRFFAGFFGGPSLVLIEGTFADVWSAQITVAYYSVLAASSFTGAAAGPLIGGFIFAYGGWRWTQWIVLILALPIYLFGIAMPDTYPREIQRRRAKRTGTPLKLLPAQSGVTLADMFTVTFLTPIKMLVTEPVVIGLSLYVGFIFGVTFQFFISIPAVLELTYSFTVQQVGIAFSAAILGSILSTVMSMAIDFSVPHWCTKNHDGTVPEEYRMLPAMIGGLMVTTSLFWIAWTAKPSVHYLSPIFGTTLYIWGAMSIIISSISYLFDAYPPRGTLSALTAAASFRLVIAAIIPLVIIQMITNLTGAWAVSTFGFISAAFAPIPWILYLFGARLRAHSKYNPPMPASMMKGHLGRDEEMQMEGMQTQGTQMQGRRIGHATGADKSLIMMQLITESIMVAKGVDIPTWFDKK